MVLGELVASAGDLAAAEAAFVTALSIDETHRGSRLRLAALRSGDFTPYLISEGYGTPEPSLRPRLAVRPARD